jgi:hypothetical protein
VNEEIAKLKSEMAKCVTDENREGCNLEMLFGEPKVAAALTE